MMGQRTTSSHVVRAWFCDESECMVMQGIMVSTGGLGFNWSRGILYLALGASKVPRLRL
jgi:hypothetical protein